MNRLLSKWVLFLAFTPLLSSLYAYSQTDEIYHERLYYLCKVWGHAKYFHPTIAEGTINWDDELLTAVNAIKDADSNEAFNEAVLNMLNEAGPVPITLSPEIEIPDSLNNNLDTEWLDATIFSEEVNGFLHDIQNNFVPKNNIYVDEAWSGGNPTFNTDSLYYVGTSYPNESTRLLGLFRYWNIINYFFPLSTFIKSY